MEGGSDAPFDSGCGPLNVPDHCGACANSCAMTGATQNSRNCSGQPDGTGAVCSYMCTNGNLDCNKIDAPNTDGCACTYTGVTTAPQCCADKCPSQHTDGLIGQSYYPSSPYFYDCVAPGTMNSTLAQDACNSYVVARGGAANYCQPFAASADAAAPDSWCAATSATAGFMGDCICWTFSGQYQGTVLDPQQAGIPSPQDCYYGVVSFSFN